jgi:hypothetical protein
VPARVARPARPKQPLGAGGGPRLVGGNYRAGMHAELQKFGRDREGSRQLALLTGIEEPGAAGAAEVTGLALSVAEDRALSAIGVPSRIGLTVAAQLQSERHRVGVVLRRSSLRSR